MADELRHSIVDSILAWIRSGIAVGMTVIAGFFTYFAWYYKEVLIPSTAPVNVTTELIVKEAGSKSTTSKSNEELQAIELAITAKNPSTRTVYLLPNCWFASGIEIWPKSASEDTWVELSGYANLRAGPSDTARTLRILEKGANLRAVEGHESWLRVVDPETSETGWIYEALAAVVAPPDWHDSASVEVNNQEPTNEGEHYTMDQITAVAAGVAVYDTILYPGESLSASYVFYVPKGKYDMLHIHVELPTTTVGDSVEVEWKVANDGCSGTYYRKVNGVRGEEITEAPDLQLQFAHSMRQLSLWQSMPLPLAAARTSRASSP